MKKFVPFILILSLLVCFIPSYNFVIYASDSVSDDDVNGGGGGHSRNNHYTGILGYINEFLMNNGYVINDENVITFNVIDSILEDDFGVDLDDYLSIYDKNNRSDLPMIYNNFADNNPSFDFDSLGDNLRSFSLNYCRTNETYYIYRSMPVSEFFNYFLFRPTVNNSSLQDFKNWFIPIVNNNIETLGAFNITDFLGDNTNFVVDYSDLLENYSLCLYSGSFNNYPDFEFQTYVHTQETTSEPYPFGSLKFFDNSLGSGYNGPFNYWTPSTSSFVQSGNNSFSQVGFVSNRFYNSNNGYDFYGTLYISPDSVGSVSFPVFRSGADLQLFYKGQADVYRVDSSVDLNKYGSDIDYSQLYDIISSSIRGNTGNVIDAINNAVDNYLQQQIDLLHDINNALNDGNGQSWLRRIYGILDYNFPLTLQAFEDLQQAIQNISISGGSSDLTHINSVLDEINVKLGFMIEEPLTNADIEDINDLKNLAQQKFPFCVFSDIVAISVILNQTPEQPHWQIPLKLPGSESVNNIEVDLSWYEDVRGLVQGVFIFIFIVGLLALSVKVFSALKS